MEGKLAKKCGNVGSKNSCLEVTWLKWQMQRRPRHRRWCKIKIVYRNQILFSSVAYHDTFNGRRLGLICVLIQPYILPLAIIFKYLKKDETLDCSIVSFPRISLSGSLPKVFVVNLSHISAFCSSSRKEMKSSDCEKHKYLTTNFFKLTLHKL